MKGGLILLLISACVSLPAQAHRKTDVITLYNGDRITGEIKSLQGARLSLSTDAMGTLSIEWKKVASLSSNYNYEMRLDDGERLFGSLAPGAIPGEVTLTDVFGEHSFSWSDIVELRPVEDSIIDRIDVYVSANYAFTKASGVTQTEFRTDLSYEDIKSLNSLTSRATVSDTDAGTTSSSRINLVRRVYTDRQQMFRLAFGGYESNDELGLDYRVNLGGGVGRYFLETNNSGLNGSFSLQAIEERSVNGDMQTSLEGVLTAGYARWRFDSPKLDFRLEASIYPSLTEQGRVRADTSGTLRWEIINDLFWDVSAWGAYDNSAVDEEAGEFDWGLTTGVGWSY